MTEPEKSGRREKNSMERLSQPRMAAEMELPTQGCVRHDGFYCRKDAADIEAVPGRIAAQALQG
jgi:hypothetical protein